LVQVLGGAAEAQVRRQVADFHEGDVIVCRRPDG